MIRPVEVNPNSMLIGRYLQRLAVASWDVTARLQSHIVIAYFYIFSAILFVYLDLSLPPETSFGLRTIQEIWGIPTLVTIFVYAVFGVAVSQPNRRPTTYLILLLPSMFYSLALAQISLNGIPLAWTAFIYTTSFTGLGIVTIHQRWQITQINVTTLREAGTVWVLEKEVKEIAKTRRKKDKAYEDLLEFFNKTTNDGTTELSADGVKLMVSYMEIFVNQEVKGA